MGYDREAALCNQKLQPGAISDVLSRSRSFSIVVCFCPIHSLSMSVCMCLQMRVPVPVANRPCGCKVPMFVRRFLLRSKSVLSFNESAFSHDCGFPFFIDLVLGFLPSPISASADDSPPPHPKGLVDSPTLVSLRRPSSRHNMTFI